MPNFAIANCVTDRAELVALLAETTAEATRAEALRVEAERLLREFDAAVAAGPAAALVGSDATAADVEEDRA